MARRIASRLGVACDVVRLPLHGLLRSALLGDGRPIARSLAESRRGSGLPATYVPFRNGIFLPSRRLRRIAFAPPFGHRFNSIDSPDYPDTTESFARKMAAPSTRVPRPAGRAGASASMRRWRG